jgi:colanic acid/amylovoran biosynthesis glycosyltransferase
VVTITHGEAGYTRKRKQVTLRYFKHKDYEALLRFGDLFLPMSEYEKQSLIDLGCDPEKIVVHKMGVDLNKFSFRSPQIKENGSIRLLSVGRLVEKKGFEYAIRAVGAVRENHPHIEYKIAGDGPLQKDLQELIDRLRINDRVELLGAVPQEKIVDLIGNAHLFLAPSVHSSDGDQEGIPVVLMEAMAKGLPVISTYHAGIPELINDGVSGLLVPERDTEALTEKLKYLIEHLEIWPKMAAAGREHVRTHHNIDALNDRLVYLFERLVTETHF